LGTTAPPRLSDSQLAELLGLVDASDSVELKLTVPEADQRSAVQALGMDPLNAQIRQVFFFDTPDLTLYKKGVVARARRVQKKGDDSVVKLRPVVPSELADDVRHSPNMLVEVDAMPGGFVCSASLKRRLPNPRVRAAALGERKIAKLFSKEQRAFFATHAPAGIELDDLKILGPLFVLKLKFQPPGALGRMVAEMWMYPDNTRILELSTKCAPGEALDAAARARAFLVKRGVNVSGAQQTKTRTALNFFAREMKPKATSRSRKPRTQRLKKTPAPENGAGASPPPPAG
jgi:hypothetical protein